MDVRCSKFIAGGGKMCESLLPSLERAAVHTAMGEKGSAGVNLSLMRACRGPVLRQGRLESARGQRQAAPRGQQVRGRTAGPTGEGLHRGANR